MERLLSEGTSITSNSFYGLAKKNAEIELLKSDSPMEIIILRPTFIWGPNSKSLDEILSKAKQGKFLWVDNGNSSFEAVHVNNVAEAVVLSLENGKSHSIYFVTDNEPITVKQFFTRYFSKMGVPIPKKSVPKFAANTLANLFEIAWKLLRLPSPPPLTRFDLSFVSMPRRYNIEKTIEELGYRPIINRENGFKNI